MWGGGSSPSAALGPESPSQLWMECSAKLDQASVFPLMFVLVLSGLYIRA